MNRKTALTLLLAALAVAAPLAAQPADAFLSGFVLSGDYVIEIDGQDQPKAELYYSDRARAFLIKASQLPSPVLISPAAREVQSLDLMKVATRPDGTIDVLADAALAPEGGFRVVDDTIVFRAAGKNVRLKPRPWLLGAHPGEELLGYNPEYQRRADEYRPDPAILSDLAARKGGIRVLTFFGSWCPHCKKHVPQLLKVSETLAKSGWQFDFYGVPSPIGNEPEAQKYSINGVPTAIVFLDGREIGRVPAALWTQPEAGLRSVLDSAKSGGAK
ncbi:MAG: thioredoxin family protein [Holophagales bacterium]|nr:thioredoxin family protein [Holophagales bacterium]